MAGSFRQLTAGGYGFGEATSSMQKSVRRGRTSDALYWSFELHSRFHKYVWRRLNTIANEDVGIVNPAVITKFWELSQGERTSLALTQAVTMLCHATKTRLSDRILCVILERQFGWIETPTGSPSYLSTLLTEALEVADEEHAFNVALSLDRVDEALLWKTLMAHAKDLDDYPIAVPATAALYGGLRDWIAAGKERGWENYLFVNQPILLMCRQPEVQPLPPLPAEPYRHFADGREVPDIALDVHTSRGRSMGRTLEDFFSTGMVVVPEYMPWADDYLERYMVAARKFKLDGAGIAKPDKAALTKPSGDEPQQLPMF